MGDRGVTVVKVLCYNSKVAGSIGPGVDSVSNRKEYQENFLGVNAAGA